MKKADREARQRVRQRHARTGERRIRAVIFVGITIVVLGLTGFLLKSAFFKPVPSAMAGNVMDVAADMSGFNKKELRIKVSEPVTLRLTSLDNSHHTDGGGKHQWAVDELGVSIVAEPESSAYKTFTPDKPGTYTYYCDVCCGGRANPTMQGKLIVEG